MRSKYLINTWSHCNRYKLLKIQNKCKNNTNKKKVKAMFLRFPKVLRKEKKVTAVT